VTSGTDVRLLATGEVSRRFKVSGYTVTRWGNSGRLLSSPTLGGRHRFFAAEVDALARGETPERARELALAEQAKLTGTGEAARTARPVRLTFPAYDMGAARIIADEKHEVGRVLAEFTGWRAFLWTAADPVPGQFNPHDMETVWCLKLGEIRKVLRERVAEKGAWWQ
jgi:hypothetical protein